MTRRAWFLGSDLAGVGTAMIRHKGRARALIRLSPACHPRHRGLCRPPGAPAPARTAGPGRGEQALPPPGWHLSRLTATSSDAASRPDHARGRLGSPIDRARRKVAACLPTSSGWIGSMCPVDGTRLSRSKSSAVGELRRSPVGWTAARSSSICKISRATRGPGRCSGHLRQRLCPLVRQSRRDHRHHAEDDPPLPGSNRWAAEITT